MFDVYFFFSESVFEKRKEKKSKIKKAFFESVYYTSNKVYIYL